MSKEQTPITAEEFLNNEVGKFVSLPEKEWWCKQMEQYAQAKVLEALERDKKFYCDNVTISRLRNTKTNAEWRRLVMNRFFAKQK